MRVPAWMVQAPGTSYSLDDYVFVETTEPDEFTGRPKVRLVHRLTPVETYGRNVHGRWITEATVAEVRRATEA